MNILCVILWPTSYECLTENNSSENELILGDVDVCHIKDTCQQSD